MSQSRGVDADSAGLEDSRFYATVGCPCARASEEEEEEEEEGRRRRRSS